MKYPALREFATDSSRWAALTSRNPHASTIFIYSVLTTRIYCRPTCPSRLARRSNIVFHDNSHQAEAAGFRPCKRCKPDVINFEQDGGQKSMIERACVLLEKEERRGDKWTVKQLATEVGLTESHFCRVFRKILGVTVGEYRLLVQNERTKRKGISTGSVTPLEIDTSTEDEASNGDMARHGHHDLTTMGICANDQAQQGNLSPGVEDCHVPNDVSDQALFDEFLTFDI
ncbi:metal binding domain of Ada-domain-containing protein [Halenospora varia]|nr:metal binding domain of Ada-domain-containing protein [Halenospora varia]